MKRISRFLSSALASMFVISCCAMTALAAPSSHTYTVSADKTENLKAGDVVTVEVKIDSTQGIFSAGYSLEFDPTVFTIDTTSGGRGKPLKYIDETFNTNISDLNGAWGWYLGAATIGQSAEEGYITYGWGGNTSAGSGVIADDNQTNYTIGKFFLSVKENAPQGETSFTISGKTYGFKENTADTMTYYYEPKKLTVGSGSSDPKGTAITEEVDGNTGYYLSNVPLSGLSQSTMFVIKYTGSDTVLNENGTKTEKRIQRNLGQILGGEFAVGTGITGNLHFGIKLPTEKASEAVNFSVVTE